MESFTPARSNSPPSWNDVIDHVLERVGGHRTNVLGGNPTISVEHDRDGQPGTAQVPEQLPVGVHDLRVGHPHLAQKRSGTGSVVLGVHTQEVDPFAVSGV